MGEFYRFSNRPTQRVKLKTGLRYAIGAFCIAGIFGFILFLFSNLGDNEDLIAGNTDSNEVATYEIDLSGNPEGVFVTPPIVRTGKVFNAESDDRCILFNVILDKDAEGVVLEQIAGEKPLNNPLYYLDYDKATPLGQSVCVDHTIKVTLSYCAPGFQTEAYRITSLSKTFITGDTAGRRGAGTMKFKVKGLIASSIKWTSIYPGVQGQYNSLLDNESGMTNVSVLSTQKSPSKILYKVTGTHISACGDQFNYIDTVSLNIYPELLATASPLNAICAPGGEVELSSTAIGGRGPYQFIWKNYNGNQISTEQKCKVWEPGVYTVEVKDALSPSSPSQILSVEVFPSANPLPSQITVQKLSQTSASVNWNPLENVYRYMVRYKTPQEQYWQYRAVLSNKSGITIKDLNPGTKYEYQLMCYSTAKTSDSSGWSMIKNFSTISECIQASSLKTKPYAYEALCYWNNNEFAFKQTIMIREQGSTNWQQSYNIGNKVNSVKIPNLKPGKSYEWMIKSLCKSGSKNDWDYMLSDVQIFKTPSLGNVASK